MASSLPSDEVAEDYKNSLEDLTLNSRYEISNLTIIAKENMDHALAISRVLENHIKTAPPNRKLPALYVLDSIVKNVGTPYTLFFGRNLYSIYMNAYLLVDTPVRKKLEEMLKTWKEPVPGSLDLRPVFPVDVTRNIESALIKARTAAVELQQKQAKAHVGRLSAPPRATPTPPNDQSIHQSNFSRAGLNGAGITSNISQPSPYHHQLPSHIGQSMRYQNGSSLHRPDSLDVLNHDIANLTAAARTEFAARPYEQGVQQRLQALLDLQSILHSQTLPPDQIDLIKDQVAQLSRASRPPPIPVTQVAAQARAPQIPAVSAPFRPPASLHSLFPPNALATLLASATPVPAHPTPPAPQPALASSGLFSQLPAVVTPNTKSVAPGVTGESTLLASLRAAGMLPPVPPPITATAPVGLPVSFPTHVSFPSPSQQSSLNSGQAITSLPNSVPSHVSTNVELTSASLKIPRPHLVSVLYEAQPSQCTTCGRRFQATDQGRLEKAKHLDWHFKVNLRIAEAVKRGQNRSWYVDELEWVRSRDRDEDEADPIAVNGSKGTADKSTASGNNKETPWVPVPEDPSQANLSCPICQDKFETVWNGEAQEWVWMDAIRVGEKVYHATCHAEVNQGGIGKTGWERGSIVLGKRKAEATVGPDVRDRRGISGPLTGT